MSGLWIYAYQTESIIGRRLEQKKRPRLRNVDFEQGTVTIQSGDDWHTKNYRSRTIEMTPVLYKTMLQQRKLHMELHVRIDYVFTYRGHRIKYMDATLKKVVKRAGLENVTLHTLRHTFASHLVMAGVSLMEVQQLMGHRSYETTLQYAHLSEDHVKKQVNRLPFANGYGKNKAKMQVYGNLTRKNPVIGKVIKLNTGAG
jgi:integrase